MKNFIVVFLLYVLSLFCYDTGHAQIIYTNVDPDQTFNTNGGTFYLDVNNDGNQDYNIFCYIQNITLCQHSAPQRYVGIQPADSNKVSGTTTNRATAFILNDLIGNNSPLLSNLYTINILAINSWKCALGPYGEYHFTHYSNGEWLTATDKYLGLKFYINGLPHFGWARLNVVVTDSIATFTIKDYAYNSMPGQQILAGETGTVLPLNFLSFNGSLKNNAAALTWSTANEINNKGFDVEKSSDGRSFEKIGFVIGKGNTSSISYYNFTDEHLINPVTYYRLKQIDYDGRFSYSKTIRVHYKNTDDFQLSVSPNPFINQTNISFTLDKPQNVSVKIFDVNGRLIRTLADKIFEKGEQRVTWDAVAVNPGMYYLKIMSAEFNKTKKLIVVK